MFLPKYHNAGFNLPRKHFIQCCHIRKIEGNEMRENKILILRKYLDGVENYNINTYKKNSSIKSVEAAQDETLFL